MINFNLYTLGQKAKIATREIRRWSRDGELRSLARRLATPQRALDWVKRTITYEREEGDILYNPHETISRGRGDCEELTVLVGTLAKIQGYPVMVRIISNSTRHIYPLVKIDNEWRPMDATPRYGLTQEYLEQTYHTVVQGIVGADRYLPVAGINNDKNAGFIRTIIEQLPVGIGFGLGAAIAALIFKKYLRGLL